MQTLIVGGGLCGLSLADALEKQGQDYLLVEGRSRFGGRILTQKHDFCDFDLGPAWFWPGQPRIAALIDRFDFKVSEQYAKGASIFQEPSGQTHLGRDYGSMQGSWRLSGGLQQLTDSLAEGLPDDRKRLKTEVTQLGASPEGVVATLRSGGTIATDRVVLAVPPRLAAGLVFNPQLPTKVQTALQETPTWMAGQAKAVVVYDRPFWREMGLSGDAISRRGPLVEIHDATPAGETSYALFGFIGIPPQAHRDEKSLKAKVIDQLIELFGPSAATPVDVLFKDWASDPLTSTSADLQPLFAHPVYGPPEALQGIWQDRLIFSGTETAPEFGGFLEGALEAAEITRYALNILREDAPNAG